MSRMVLDASGAVLPKVLQVVPLVGWSVVCGWRLVMPVGCVVRLVRCGLRACQGRCLVRSEVCRDLVWMILIYERLISELTSPLCLLMCKIALAREQRPRPPQPPPLRSVE